MNRYQKQRQRAAIKLAREREIQRSRYPGPSEPGWTRERQPEADAPDRTNQRQSSGVPGGTKGVQRSGKTSSGLAARTEQSGQLNLLEPEPVIMQGLQIVGPLPGDTWEDIFSVYA